MEINANMFFVHFAFLTDFETIHVIIATNTIHKNCLWMIMKLLNAKVTHQKLKAKTLQLSPVK